MVDGEITKYILDSNDKSSHSNKFPYWFGLFFSTLALLTSSIKFIVISFFVGLIIGILFSYVKSKIFWKQLPYWLKGGVVGGGVVFISVVLTQFCEYQILVPGYSGLGFECFPFAVPWIPFWFIPNFVSLKIYEGAVILIWFASGSVLGYLFGYIKSKKLSNKKEPTFK